MDKRDAVAMLRAMSDGAQRLLWEESRWWILPDGGLRFHLLAQRADVDAAYELANTLSEAFDLPFDEAAPVDDGQWSDDASCPADDGVTFAELRNHLGSA